MDAKRFKNKKTENLFLGIAVKGLPADVARRAKNKLTLVFAASMIDSLRYPPGNHLEALKGNRKGQWSIRVNNQWRICFEWHNGQAIEIEIVDYH
ncbi:MAG: type II toxin-antitoxin system RelE/ParE family toxin [Alphaproteobacteria bacterium]|nr:type II toxin-antitoxin system RelE/ParE family toxin [Alphaproteobacteria bacterium]